MKGYKIAGNLRFRLGEFRHRMGIDRRDREFMYLIRRVTVVKPRIVDPRFELAVHFLNQDGENCVKTFELGHHRDLDIIEDIYFSDSDLLLLLDGQLRTLNRHFENPLFRASDLDLFSGYYEQFLEDMPEVMAANNCYTPDGLDYLLYSHMMSTIS